MSSLSKRTPDQTKSKRKLESVTSTTPVSPFESHIIPGRLNRPKLEGKNGETVIYDFTDESRNRKVDDKRRPKEENEYTWRLQSVTEISLD